MKLCLPETLTWAQTLKPENAELNLHFNTVWFCDLGWVTSLTELPLTITEIGMSEDLSQRFPPGVKAWSCSCDTLFFPLLLVLLP